jgi:hypothetical protein
MRRTSKIQIASNALALVALTATGAGAGQVKINTVTPKTNIPAPQVNQPKINGPQRCSSVTVKRNISLLKKLDNGLNLYRFRYLWNDTVYVGLMAEEVESLYPDAVVKGPEGYLGVIYESLGMQLMTWDDWTRKMLS